MALPLLTITPTNGSAVTICNYTTATDYYLVSAAFPAPALIGSVASALDARGRPTERYELAERTLTIDCLGSSEADALTHVAALQDAIRPGAILAKTDNSGSAVLSTRILRGAVVAGSYDKIRRQRRIRVVVVLTTEPYWEGALVTGSGTGVSSGLGYITVSSVGGDTFARSYFTLAGCVSGYSYLLGVWQNPVESSVLTATSGNVTVIGSDPPIVMDGAKSGANLVLSVVESGWALDDYADRTLTLAVGSYTWRAAIPLGIQFVAGSTATGWVGEPGAFNDSTKAAWESSIYAPPRLAPGTNRVYVAGCGSSAHGTITVTPYHYPRFLTG